jgi:hypothetical protein
LIEYEKNVFCVNQYSYCVNQYCKDYWDISCFFMSKCCYFSCKHLYCSYFLVQMSSTESESDIENESENLQILKQHVIRGYFVTSPLMDK